MNKKITQLRWLAATLTLVAAMVMPSTAWADGSITPTKPSGDGTADSPYQISNEEELYWFAGLVNGTLEGVTLEQDAWAVLTADIEVSGTWTPIMEYEGTFDGQGHTISELKNVHVNYPLGLFGMTKNSSVIRNVGIVNCEFFSGTNVSVGGVCGENDGSIENCYTTGSIKTVDGGGHVGGVCGKNGGTIKNCYNIGSVEGIQGEVGGVCGLNNGTIENCYNTGTVEGIQGGVGGVCGLNNGTIENCYNTGTVDGIQGEVGGVCGLNNGTIENCYNTGSVSEGRINGGVCGGNTGNGTITNCYYLSGTALGGIDRDVADVPGSAEVKIAAQFMNGEICYLLNGASPEGGWGQQIGTDDYPVPGSDKKVYEVNLLCGGVKAVGKTYVNSNKDVTIAHELPEAANFNAVKNIYKKVCQREACGETIYYANAAGTIEAKPNADATEFTVTNYSLQDATTYDNKAVFTATNFIHTRTFSNANWTTWYVPFDLTLTEEICAQYDFSRINNVHQYDTDNDGTADKTVVESFRQMPGVTLKANYPYLVKPVSEGDLNMVLPLEGVKPALAMTNSIDCQSVDFSYTFTGTYTAMGEGGFGYYDPYTLWTDGTWQHFRSLDPMRHYLTVTPRNPFFASAASLRSIMLSVIGDEGTTGIVNMYSDERKAAETYDLGGCRLPAGASQRGMMIENGKVIIKK